MDFTWRSFAFGFRLLLLFHLCWTLLHYLFMICVLHELGLWFVVGFEHLVCNVWWTMLICVTLIYLCSSCGFEVVLTKLKFISYIYLVSCLPRFPLVGETPSKFSNFIYMCSWYSFKIYKHVSRGSSLYSSNLDEFIHIIFWNVSRKMSKFFQSSIPSPPYALCIKLTWTLLSLQNLVLSSITKKGELESI